MIELRNVTKNYGTINALSDVSLTVNDGDFFALLGPNGAGKTTILRILLDFTQATSGEAFIDGKSSRDQDARASIGYLPENLKIPAWLTGREFLIRQAQLYGMSKDQMYPAVEKVLETVGMRERAGSKSSTYSKGMVQRIGLASALLPSPKHIILDEPGNGLDPIGTREFRLILEDLRNRGVTLILNSHILSEVEKICTSAAIMKRGMIMAKDTIANLVREGESLEDVFIRLTGK